MPQRRITHLMNLWAASLLKHGDVPPFADNADLEQVIDATALGGIPWQSFTVRYNGARPDGNVPSWMTADHEVWFKSPRLIAHYILGNTEIKDEVDTVPYRVFVNPDPSKPPRHQYGHFMSANWPWEQVVRFDVLQRFRASGLASSSPGYHRRG